MKRYLCRFASAAALALAGAGSAQAVPAYAFAGLNFQNFTLTGVVTPTGGVVGTIVPGSLTASVTSSDNASYPGFPSVINSAGGDVVSGTDVSQATAGPGPFPGQNTFNQSLLPSLALTPAGTRGDARIAGALASGQTTNLVAEGKLSTIMNAVSGATTNITLNFTTSATAVVNLTFAASSSLFAQVAQSADSANAQVATEFRIFDSTLGQYVNITDNINAANSSNDIKPGGLNQSALTTDPAAAQTLNSPLTAYSYTAVLSGGHNFQFQFMDSTGTMLQSAATVSAAVPESSSTIAMLGFALAVLGALRRRCKV